MHFPFFFFFISETRARKNTHTHTQSRPYPFLINYLITSSYVSNAILDLLCFPHNIELKYDCLLGEYAHIRILYYNPTWMTEKSTVKRAGVISQKTQYEKKGLYLHVYYIAVIQYAIRKEFPANDVIIFALVLMCRIEYCNLTVTQFDWIHVRSPAIDSPEE